MSDLLQSAIAYATVAHAGQTRKGTDIPYIVHPIEVMKIVASITPDEEIRAAAVLHDTVEDTGTTPDTLSTLFGSRVRDMVCSVSEKKRPDLPEEFTWRTRKQETIGHIKTADQPVQIICLGDKLANMRDITRDYKNLGDAFWARFNAPQDDEGLLGKRRSIGWYYRSIAEALQPALGTTPAWQELEDLITTTFPAENIKKHFRLLLDAVAQYNTEGVITIPCPICGSALVYDEVGNSGTLRCVKKGCIRTTFRGL